MWFCHFYYFLVLSYKLLIKGNPALNFPARDRSFCVVLLAPYLNYWVLLQACSKILLEACSLICFFKQLVSSFQMVCCCIFNKKSLYGRLILMCFYDIDMLSCIFNKKTFFFIIVLLIKFCFHFQSW